MNSFPSKRTYKIEKGPPATPYSDYQRSASQDFKNLLSAQGTTESELQEFLEDHPSFMPGVHGPGAASAQPLYWMLVSQPRLPGLDARQPDFMWLSWNSDTWFPVLIEIEAPTKRLFKSKGVPRAEFTQARNQLSQWRSWFERPANRLKFEDDYGLPPWWRESFAMRLHMILIYGRRSEFLDNTELTRQRTSLLPGDDEELMSFDRLQPDSRMRNVITTRATGVGKFQALRVPPTVTNGPNSAERLLAIEDVETAVHRSAGWTEERRDFFVERLLYWREWAKLSDIEKGWVTASDEE